MGSDNAMMLMLFVQQRLYEGLLPNENGYYIIRRKEFLDRIPMAPSTFANRIRKLTDYYMKSWDLQIFFGLKGLSDENLYTDISYTNGMLRFKKNPYVERQELSYVWARKPLDWEGRRFIYETPPIPDTVVLPIRKDILK